METGSLSQLKEMNYRAQKDASNMIDYVATIYLIDLFRNDLLLCMPYIWIKISIFK